MPGPAYYYIQGIALPPHAKPGDEFRVTITLEDQVDKQYGHLAGAVLDLRAVDARTDEPLPGFVFPSVVNVPRGQDVVRFKARTTDDFPLGTEARLIAAHGPYMIRSSVILIDEKPRP